MWRREGEQVDLEGRSALVTGGAGGLGGATVRHLVKIGLGVTIFDRDLERGHALAGELGTSAVAIGGDVNDDEAVAAAIDAARRLGTFSLVVNVAGGGVGGGRTVGRDGTPQARLRRDDGDERLRHVQRLASRGRGDGHQRTG
jgi:NAD(P)-dependent dehydrogenase (short-subunit alcohol dehydrogenase family)